MKQINYLSALNRKKILHINALYIILAIMFMLSIYNMHMIKRVYLAWASDSGRFEVADGTEYRHWHKNQALDDALLNQVIDKYRDLELPREKKNIEIADLHIAEKIASIYGWDFKNIGRITEAQFYQKRSTIMNSTWHGELIELGYGEGWKNIDLKMNQCVLIVQFFLIIVLVPVFNEDEQIGMDYLIKSTKHGKQRLCRLRIINGFQLSLMLYLSAVVIYVVPIFFMYGVQGANLPIQGSEKYFFSPVLVTYREQFFLNVSIGLLGTFLMTAIVLLVSSFIKQNYTGYVVLIFILVVSYTLNTTGDFVLSRYLGSFLPTGVTEMVRYYLESDFLLGLPRLVVVPLFTFVIIIILTILATKKAGKRCHFVKLEM